MAKTPKKYTSSILMKLAKALVGGNSSPYDQVMSAYPGASPILDANNQFTGKFDYSQLSPEDAKAAETLFNNATATQDLSGGVGLGQLGSLGIGAVVNHPFKAAGLVGSTAGNIGGFTDNDKFGGQLAGLGLGGLGAYALNAAGVPVSPYTMYMMTSGGGNLGALFDKLRARKEQEQAQPYYGGR